MDTDATDLTGRLVVATPGLRDPNFARTVVLLLVHSGQGAIGVVLNRPSEVAVDAVLPRWSGRAAAPGVVFTGGPVQTDALIGLGALDAVGEPGTGPAGLAALDLASSPDGQPAAMRVRLFAGYAGWGAGQLEGEIAAGGWFVVPAGPADALSDHPAQLWRDVLVRQGGLFRTVPEDPSAN